MNPAAARIFGYEPAELVGRPLLMLVPESVGDRAAYLRNAFARAIGRITEWRGRRKNGEEFPFELSMFEFKTAAPAATSRAACATCRSGTRSRSSSRSSCPP